MLLYFIHGPPVFSILDAHARKNRAGRQLHRQQLFVRDDALRSRHDLRAHLRGVRGAPAAMARGVCLGGFPLRPWPTGLLLFYI